MYGIPSHIERFIRNLKRTNPSASITLFSDRDKQSFSGDTFEYIDEYIQRDTYSGWPHRLWKFRPLFNRYAYVKQFKKLVKERHYDIVNIHFPTCQVCPVMRSLKKISNTIVVSPWGSDVLRVDPKKKKRLSRIFKNADYITVSSTGIFGKVLHQEMRIAEDKFYPLAWGSETIDYINDHVFEITKERAKEILHLSGKYLITCGYNAFEEQRHEVIINAIESKRGELPDNMTLVFPVTYGSSYGNRKHDYVERLKTLCDELQLPVVFFEDYLSVSELFVLRRATDMFIHVQTTDGGNSSLQEYVLCGAKVIHGAWIQYVNLEQYKPLFYYPVNSLDELGDVVVNAYCSDPIQTPNQVLDYIRNRGWKAKMKLWDDFFTALNRKHSIRKRQLLR